MKKIIEYCGDCGHLSWHRNSEEYWCKIINRPIDNTYNFPDWCPKETSPEQKTGKWIEPIGYTSKVCSICCYWHDSVLPAHYCPICGSKNEVEKP